MHSYHRFARVCAAFFFIFMALCALRVRAQVQGVDPILITASRMPELNATQTRDATIITAREIQDGGATSVAEVLARVPGVEIVNYGNAGATSGVFLRGANANQTLVLIDGQRVASSTAGTTALEAIPLAMIERIEVVRGPMSTLYGADAIGGVIQIFTKRDAGGRVAVRGGTSRFARLDANGGFVCDGWTFNASASHERSDGFSAIANPNNFSYNPDRDGYARSGGTLRIGYQFASNTSAFVRLLHNDLDAQYDGSATFDDRTRTRQSAWRVGIDHGTTLLRAGESEDDSRIASDFPARFRTRTLEVSAQHQLNLTPALDALAIVDYRRERVGGSETFDVTARRTLGTALRLQARLTDVTTHATIRVDDNAQFGTRTTASGGLAWAFAPNLQLVANIGSAFKAPTFNDLYYPGFSNPLLKPERSVGGDVGLRAALDRATLSAVAYSNRVRDLIIFQCDANFNCAPQNVARATLDGLTLNAQITLSSTTTLRASADIQSAKNTDTDARLPRRSAAHGTLGLTHTHGARRLMLDVTASDRRFDDVANKVPLKGYVLVHLGADWQIAPSMVAELRVRNAFDARYELARDFATARREVFAGVRWSLQ